MCVMYRCDETDYLTDEEFEYSREIRDRDDFLSLQEEYDNYLEERGQM